MQLESTDDHLSLAYQHISHAIEQLERRESDVFAQAAFESRITAYGNHCRRHALLKHIANDLKQLYITAA